MTVVRVRIQKDFTIVYNGVLENPNLSFKAKGLWAYCMSRPDNWQFHVTQLAKVSQDRKSAIYSALKELEKEGLVQKEQSKVNGKFGPVDYIIYPYPQEIQKILPLTDFPRTENQPLISTDSNQELTPPKSPPPKKSPSERLRSKLEGEFSEYSKELFEKAWQEYEKEVKCTEIKNPKGWIKNKLETLAHKEALLKPQEPFFQSECEARAKLSREIYERFHQNPSAFASLKSLSIDMQGNLFCGFETGSVVLSPFLSSDEWNKLFNKIFGAL